MTEKTHWIHHLPAPGPDNIAKARAAYAEVLLTEQAGQIVAFEAAAKALRATKKQLAMIEAVLLKYASTVWKPEEISAAMIAAGAAEAEPADAPKRGRKPKLAEAAE
jgi:hypothetical protein